MGERGDPGWGKMFFCSVSSCHGLFASAKWEWRFASQREGTRGAVENGRCPEEVFEVTEPRKSGEEVVPKCLVMSLYVHGIFPNIRIPYLSREQDESGKWGEGDGGCLHPQQRAIYLVNRFLGCVGSRVMCYSVGHVSGQGVRGGGSCRFKQKTG